MPIPFVCPHCGTQTLVDDRYANQRGDCATCGREITVPPLPSATAEPSSQLDPKRKSQWRSLAKALALSLGGLALMAALTGIVLEFVLPVVRSNQLKQYRAQSNTHLQRIAQAMRAYHDAYNSYPPAYIPDSNGRPMHSWRVLLLPYLDEMAIYGRYDFNKPWDEQDPAIEAPLEMPAVYSSPADEDGQVEGHTSFVVIVGNRTMFPGARAIRSEQIRDGLSATIMVVERHNSQIPWYQPEDLRSEKMRFEVNGRGQEVASNHTGGAWLVMANGKTYFVREQLSPDYLQSLITIDGGERVPLSEIGGAR